MNWSSLFPSTLNPFVVWQRLLGLGYDLATRALRDLFIFANLALALGSAIFVAFQTADSWQKSGPITAWPDAVRAPSL